MQLNSKVTSCANYRFLGISFIAFCFAFMFQKQAFSQSVPQRFSYQAVIRDEANQLLNSPSVGIRLSILQDSATGTAVYVEKHTVTTITKGLVSLQVGGGIVVSGVMAQIDWAAGPYFIKTETDPSGGANYTITGTSQMLSVPYALFSSNGTPGPQGPAGPTGPTGATGAQGPIGLTGPTGAQGPVGPQGATGPQGTGVTILGSFGSVGQLPVTGSAGDGYLVNGNLYVWSSNTSSWSNVGNIQGPQGLAGEVGPQGPAGQTGANGTQGPIGQTGPAGATGPQGPIGLTGPSGAKGDKGDIGATGATGPQGPIGLTGPSGAKGDKGDTGATGATGSIGAQGPIGLTGTAGTTGAQGPVGPKGDPGTGVSNGSVYGQMLFWNGLSWDTLNPGKQGQMMLMCLGKPTWAVGGRCPGLISGFACGQITQYGTLVSGIQSNEISISIPYAGGNSGGYEGLIIPSNGVTGLTASLSSGYFSESEGQIFLGITGTPGASGSASFQLNLGGKSCAISLPVLPQASVGNLKCQNAIPSDSVFAWYELNNFTIRVPYSNGNGGILYEQNYQSSGVAGLSARILYDTISSGNGELVMNISGTPQGSGTAAFSITLGNITCTISIGVYLRPASLTINCPPCPNDNSILSGTLSLGTAATGLTLRIPYSNSNGGFFPAQTITSNGITGLTAHLNAGILSNPNGELIYSISGTPANPGISADFGINISGQNCSVSLNVDIPAAHTFCSQENILNPELSYGSLTDQDGNLYKTIKIGAQTWMAENLRTNHFLNGDPVNAVNYFPDQDCRFGLSYSNSDVVNPAGLCPLGWHLPSGDEWGILINGLGGNETANLKLFSAYPKNGCFYNATEKPNNSSGLSLVRTNFAYYCTGPGDPPPFGDGGCSTCYPYSAWGGLWASDEKLVAFFTPRIDVSSMYFSGCAYTTAGARCVKNNEAGDIASIQNLNCSGSINSGTLISETPAADVSVTLPYSGGNAGIYFSQTATSEGVIGLTASLAPGTLQSGSGNLVWVISGTPQSSGTASFLLSVAGKSCLITRNVN